MCVGSLRPSAVLEVGAFEWLCFAFPLVSQLRKSIKASRVSCSSKLDTSSLVNN